MERQDDDTGRILFGPLTRGGERNFLDTLRAENVGALRDYSARLLRKLGVEAPHSARAPREAGSEGEDNLAHLERPGALFETLGFHYTGPVDGHDLPALTRQLEQLREARGPQLLHVITVKGKGFEPAEADPIKYHGVTQFDPVTGDWAVARWAADTMPDWQRLAP